MTGQHLVAVEQQVHWFVEGDLAAPEQAQPAAVANSLDCRLHDRGIEARRIVSLEAEQDAAVRAMPEAGERERSVQLREHFGRTLQQSACLEVKHEKARREHRSHRVRRRWADADLENVEHRQVHRAASRRRIRSAISAASATRNDSSSCSLASTAVSSYP